MELLQDGLIAFFSAVGVTACVWLAAGAVPALRGRGVPGVELVLPLRGDAPAMEADVRTLLRLRCQLPGARIVLRDCGMSEAARDMAEYFCDRHRDVELRTENK